MSPSDVYEAEDLKIRSTPSAVHEHLNATSVDLDKLPGMARPMPSAFLAREQGSNMRSSNSTVCPVPFIGEYYLNRFVVAERLIRIRGALTARSHSSELEARICNRLK